MKILLIEYRDITHPEAGGAELLLFEVFSRIVQAGHAVDYLCCSYAGAKPVETIRGIRVIRQGGQMTFNFVVPFFYRRHLRQNRYDVIIEGIDKLPFYMPLFESKIPVVCTIPHLFGKAVFQEVNFILGSYVYAYELLIPFVYKNCFISALSDSTQADLIRRGLRQDLIEVVYTGLSQEKYTAPPNKSPRHHPIILYVGRVKKYKGVDIGLRAVRQLAAKYPDIEYQIVGSGDYVPTLKALAAEYRLERNVTFCGYVSHERKVELMQQADVLIYCSPKEGWGLSVIEANACGTVAVASNSPGLCEAVLDQKTGFLTPHGDVGALAGHIDRLLSDAVLYERMRRAALDWAAGFSWDRTAQKTTALLEKAIAAHSAHRIKAA